MQRYTDKVAIVTGAAGGIGLATAQRLGAEGARVVLVDLDRARLDAAVPQVL
jgi:NAD(P)-dependent dehydrogenase (short-subunit alcohol dehydrogenase family)